MTIPSAFHTAFLKELSSLSMQSTEKLTNVTVPGTTIPATRYVRALFLIGLDKFKENF